MEYLTLQIEPLDTLFFKDGKPFAMGDDSWADGVFPPAPSVIYGALRSWILANNKSITIENVEKETSDLEIHDIYYLVNGNTVLPLPMDYGEKKGKDNQEQYDENKGNIKKVERFSLKNIPSVTSVPQKTVLYNKNENDYILEQPKNAFITKADFIEYLKNENKSAQKITAQTVNNDVESKIGIKRTNETLNSEDGNLYRVGMNRFTNLKFVVRAQSKYLANNFDKFLKLGGEGKIVVVDEYLTTKMGAKELKIKTDLTSKNLLLYLATPAIFENEIPDLEKHLGLKGKLIASSIGKAVNIGGFDMKAKQPKIMYKAVPAGSVYFFELENEFEIDKLQGKKISDKLGIEGFGIAYFGTYNVKK